MKIHISSSSADAAIARANASRDSMARLMTAASHDLKQPLQVALLSIVRAIGEGASPRIRGRLGVAVDALRRMNDELEAMAQISRRDEALAPDPRIVFLADVLERAERAWRPFAEICGTQLQIVYPRCFVETDPEMLGTILRNLIGNAIKSSGPGGNVSVGVRFLEGRIAIDVHDSGRGIDPEMLPDISADLTRGARTDRDGGLSLGLLIVRDAAELLGHPVTLRSLNGEGSTFSVEVPRVGGRFLNADDLEVVQ